VRSCFGVRRTSRRGRAKCARGKKPSPSGLRFWPAAFLKRPFQRTARADLNPRAHLRLPPYRPRAVKKTTRADLRPRARESNCEPMARASIQPARTLARARWPDIGLTSYRPRAVKKTARLTAHGLNDGGEATLIARRHSPRRTGHARAWPQKKRAWQLPSALAPGERIRPLATPATRAVALWRAWMQCQKPTIPPRA